MAEAHTFYLLLFHWACSMRYRQHMGRLRKRDNLLTGEGGEVGGGARSEPHDLEKVWPSISHSLLSDVEVIYYWQRHTLFIGSAHSAIIASPASACLVPMLADKKEEGWTRWDDGKTIKCGSLWILFSNYGTTSQEERSKIGKSKTMLKKNFTNCTVHNLHINHLCVKQFVFANSSS